MRPAVLIVEDDEDTLAVLELLLSYDFDCQSVRSRDDAFALLKSGYEPACVLMDFHMPGMSLSEFLKESQQFNLEVILITADLRAEHIAKVFKFRHFLKKPVLADTIVSTVKQVVASG